MNAYHKSGMVLVLAAAAVLGAASWAHADSCCATHSTAATRVVAQNQPAGHEGHVQDGQVAPGDAQQAQRAEKAEAKSVTVTGTNYCIGCSVTNKESAMAECERNGHKMAVKVRDAKDVEGKPVPALKGRVLRYAANDDAKTLADRARWGEQVTLEGTISKSGRQLTIAQIAPESEGSQAVKLPTSTQADADRYVASLPEGVRYYTCTMHPEVVSDKAGDCPKCGMKLVERAKGPSEKGKPAEKPAEEKPAAGHDHSAHQH